MGKLAISGGKPVRKKPFTAWPIYTQKERQGLLKVLTSRNWGLGGRPPTPGRVLS